MATEAHDDDANLDALSEVVVNHFKITPAAVGPFGSANLSWSVSAPSRVSIYLDNQKVSRSGTIILTPSFSETHRLSARAGGYYKSLGVETVHVNESQCITISDASLPKILAAKITDEINGDETGLSFRWIQSGQQGPFPTYVKSKPDVRITADKRDGSKHPKELRRHERENTVWRDPRVSI
jgi:hypothetical protein